MSSVNQDLSHVTEKQTLTTDALEAGGTLPRWMFDEFVMNLQDTADLLADVRVETVNDAKTRIPKFNVGERVRTAQGENEPGEYTDFDTDSIDIDAEKSSVYWRLSSETVEDNVEGEALADKILDHLTEQFSNDTQDLALNGDEGATGFEAQNDGWLEIADARGMPVLDGVNETFSQEVMQEVIIHMDAKIRARTNPVMLISRDQFLKFQYNLVERETPLGDSIIMGDEEVNPFTYPIRGVSYMPDDKALFTDYENLIYALYRDVELDVLTESDEVFDNDLFAKYAIRTRDDFQIEREEAGVLVTDLEEPFAEEET